MGNFAKLIILFVVSSCIHADKQEKSTNTPANSKMVTTTLRDSLGTVSFLIPLRFDTSFTWTNRSDCGKPCDHEQYRFQQKSFPVFKESGFYYDIPDIPIDQFTIIHSGYFPFHNGRDTSRNSIHPGRLKEQLLSDPGNGKSVFDSIEKIGDRYFSIVYMEGFDTAHRKHFAKVAASTIIKGNEIEFHYDLKTQDLINEKQFFDDATRFLRTIRLSNGI